MPRVSPPRLVIGFLQTSHLFGIYIETGILTMHRATWAVAWMVRLWSAVTACIARRIRPAWHRLPSAAKYFGGVSGWRRHVNLVDCGRLRLLGTWGVAAFSTRRASKAGRWGLLAALHRFAKRTPKCT